LTRAASAFPPIADVSFSCAIPDAAFKLRPNQILALWLCDHGGWRAAFDKERAGGRSAQLGGRRAYSHATSRMRQISYCYLLCFIGRSASERGHRESRIELTR